MYLPPLLRRKNAGYGVPSGTKWSPLEGVPGVDEGIMRLWVLTDGVMKGVFAAGVLSDELVPERVLSLLRERLDDDGDSGSCAEAMVSGSVLMRPPLSFALRLRARSLCSLKILLLLSRGASGGGRGGTRKLEDGIVAAWQRDSACVQAVAAGCRGDRLDNGNVPGLQQDILLPTCDSRAIAACAKIFLVMDVWADLDSRCAGCRQPA